MEQCWNIRFHGQFQDFGLEIGINSCLDEFKICENKRSVSFFDP